MAVHTCRYALSLAIFLARQLNCLLGLGTYLSATYITLAISKMTVPFGFSAGDIAEAIKLIAKIAKALKESGGSATEYQDTMKSLGSQLLMLQHLEAIHSKIRDKAVASTLQVLALRAKQPILEFMERTRKYESSLGTTRPSKSMKRALHKCDWALRVVEDARKLRTCISADLEAVHLLLASESL